MQSLVPHRAKPSNFCKYVVKKLYVYRIFIIFALLLINSEHIESVFAVLNRKCGSFRK